jgi:ParB family chromosome partitioning protein
MGNARKIVLSPSRDIPFDRLVLSQSNVRTTKCGVSIDALADDIARRTLLQSLNVRPMRDEAGAETGLFEVPAGGRRYRALERLVAQKRLAKDAPIPCVVRTVSGDNDPSAAEDSLAENVFREALHPLDQFRAMQVLTEEGAPIEDIAARFMTTPAVVRQRLKLAAVSPVLCQLYAEDGMTLDQLMAFSVCDDHQRQEQLWDSFPKFADCSAATIRRRLTEASICASDRRVVYVGIDAYVAAGGTMMRDLFEEDRGGWLQDVGLLEQLVMEKLGADGEKIGTEGWKWVSAAIDHDYGHQHGMRAITGFDVPIDSDEQARIEALKAELEAIEAEYGQSSDVPVDVNDRYDTIQHEVQTICMRPVTYDPDEMARAGAFVSLDRAGSLSVERGFVRPQDEPVVERDAPGEGGDSSVEQVSDAADRGPAIITVGDDADGNARDDDDEGMLKPLPEKLVTELTVHRTLALSNALAASPSVAFHTVLHAMVLSVFYYASRESCVAVSLTRPQFLHQEPGLAETPSALAIEARYKHWKSLLPSADRDLWDALLAMSAEDQGALFAHCASYAVNAVSESVGRYDNGRISSHLVERRIAHSHVLARAVGLDMVAAGWTPTVDRYLGRVTKPHIIEAVGEALGADKAGLIDHLKKGDMASQAERLLEGSGWLPEPLRTPPLDDAVTAPHGAGPDAENLVTLPAFLEGTGGEAPGDGSDPDSAEYAIAAE